MSKIRKTEMNSKVEDNDLWESIEAYYRDNNLLSHQIDSYHDFISRINHIISEDRIVVETEPPKISKKEMYVATYKKKKLVAVSSEENVLQDVKAFTQEHHPKLFKMITNVKHISKVKKMSQGKVNIVPFLDIKDWSDFQKVEKGKEYRPYGKIKIPKYVVEFGEVILQPPTHKEINSEIREIFPKECTDRDITYSSNLFVNIKLKTPLGTKLYERFHIGSIPVMVKSDLCNMKKYADDPEIIAKLKEDFCDYGGYFIIKGNPKVIASQQRTAPNMIYVFQNRKNAPKFEIYSEVKSIPILGSHSTTAMTGLLKDSLSVMIPYIETPIPLGVMFRALGVESEQELIDYICPREDREMIELIIPSLEQSYTCNSQETALHFIGRKGKKFNGSKKIDEEEVDAKTGAISYAKHLIETEFLPHVGSGEDASIDKRYYLGLMVKKVLEVKLGRASFEDRDHFRNKRLASVGMLLSQQFYHAVKKLKNEITAAINRCVTGNNTVNITSIIKPSVITSVMNSALSINNWIKLNNAQGISQTYDKFNYSAILANSRKMNIPMSESGKVELPRKLHGSQWGIVCASETPEGKKVGLVSNMANMAFISIDGDPHAVIDLIHTMNIIEFREAGRKIHTMYTIFVNGIPIGLTQYPEQIVNELVLLRRSASIDPETSIAFSAKSRTIHISTDAGRMMRPLLIVEKGNLVITKKELEDIKKGLWDTESSSAWTKLISLGYIEYIDKAEEESLLVAMFPSDLEEMSSVKRLKISHCEMHPSMMYGIGSCLVPYADHDQSPRITYQAAMGKQAIGVPGTNYMFQTKGTFHVMNYPQKPLTATRMAKIIGYDKMPAGQNAVVMVCPWYGLNQEDSIIMNQDSIDRGFMLITTYMAYDAKVRIEKDERFEVPLKEECNNYRGNPSKLDPVTGIVAEGQYVEEGDILIGKTVQEDPSQTIHHQIKKNVSVLYDHSWKGKVHLVQKGIDGQGYEYVRVVIAQQRPPENGDKFSAAHGQKGTVGERYRSYDLPFTSEGITADILINPLAFPSRMTIGMLIEMITGRKVASTSMLNHIPTDKVFREDDDEWDNDHSVSKDYGRKKTKYSKFKSDGDATPFDKNFSLERICKELKSLGINEFCDEMVTNGQTGEQMKCLVFTGLCYYQRLRHMVIDKIHARSRGGHARLTRQPKEGRKLGGGFRIGVMERDAIYAQGCPYFGKDRLMEQSDQHRMWFCRICGLPTLNIAGDFQSGVPPRRECRICETTKAVEIKLPYATKLLMQEFLAMNVVIRVLTLSCGEVGDYAVLVSQKEGKDNVVGKGIITKVK